MTWLSRVMGFFPALHLGAILAAFGWFCARPGVLAAAAVPAAIYLLPLACFRVHQVFHPVKEGISYLRTRSYSPWWGSHQLQVVFLAIPTFEVVLRLVPGLFTLWLRAWGAKVGEGVYWTPHLDLLDRGFVEVGDHVIFGHRVGIYPHVIRPKDGDLLLYLRRVRIGSGVFVGAGSHLGPGVRVAEGAVLKVDSKIYPNRGVDREE